MTNTLYYGDNLDVLRRHVQDESVDLIYLDPPFKSNQDYNVLFQEQDGSRSAAQIRAFEDTWQWDQAAAAAYEGVVEEGGQVALAMQGFRTLLGESDMLAYLSMMAPRLKELRRVLKPTGSIYLHCDPTASHYLKMLMDAVFGANNFRNEITWKRRVGMSSAVHESNRFGTITDILLFYAKTEGAAFCPQYNSTRSRPTGRREDSRTTAQGESIDCGGEWEAGGEIRGWNDGRTRRATRRAAAFYGGKANNSGGRVWPRK